MDAEILKYVSEAYPKGVCSVYCINGKDAEGPGCDFEFAVVISAARHSPQNFWCVKLVELHFVVTVIRLLLVFMFFLVFFFWDACVCVCLLSLPLIGWFIFHIIPHGGFLYNFLFFFLLVLLFLFFIFGISQWCSFNLVIIAERIWIQSGLLTIFFL